MFATIFFIILLIENMKRLLYSAIKICCEFLHLFVLFTLAVNSESMHPVHWDIYWEEFQILPPYHKLPCLEAAVRLFSQHPLSSHPTPASAIAKNAVTKRDGDETRKDWPNTLFSLFGNSKIRHALSHLPKLINEWINNYQTVW